MTSKRLSRLLQCVKQMRRPGEIPKPPLYLYQDGAAYIRIDDAAERIARAYDEGRSK